MNELSHGHGMGMYGAKTGSRQMHASFYGETAGVTEQHATGASLAEISVAKLADKEWQKAGLESLFPPELVNLIGQLTAGIGVQLDKVMDFLAEAASAESLRQKFGKPQVPGALAVAINLTSLAEQAFSEAQNVAASAEQKIAWLRTEIQKTILVWLLTEEARHQAVLAQLEKTELEVGGLKITTSQAGVEATSVKTILSQRKAEIELLIKKAQEKVTRFFYQTANSTSLKTAEVVVFSTRNSAASLPILEANLAIPISTDI